MFQPKIGLLPRSDSGFEQIGNQIRRVCKEWFIRIELLYSGPGLRQCMSPAGDDAGGMAAQSHVQSTRFVIYDETVGMLQLQLQADGFYRPGPGLVMVRDLTGINDDVRRCQIGGFIIPEDIARGGMSSGIIKPAARCLCRISAMPS